MAIKDFEFFFVNSENLGIRIFQKKCLIYKREKNKLEIAQDCVSQILNPYAFFFFLLAGATLYYHAIYTVFT